MTLSLSETKTNSMDPTLTSSIEDIELRYIMYWFYLQKAEENPRYNVILFRKECSPTPA